MKTIGFIITLEWNLETDWQSYPPFILLWSSELTLPFSSVVNDLEEEHFLYFPPSLWILTKTTALEAIKGKGTQERCHPWESVMLRFTGLARMRNKYL